MYTWDELLTMIQRRGKESILDECIYNKQCKFKRDLTESEEYEIAVKILGFKF